MATSALAQETVFALRRKIAKIEGTLPEFLAGTVPRECALPQAVLRRGGVMVRQAAADLLPTGATQLDGALGGGLPKAALTEIHGSVMHGAGAAAGFALAMAGLILKTHGAEGEDSRPPILWIGVRDAFTEAGFPYARGLAAFSGVFPEELLISQVTKLTDALWVAEEAARLKQLAAVFLEIHGNPDRLDLTATRRLHRRALEAGRPVFLLRQSAEAWPTAAPVRLVVSSAPAAPRSTLAGPLEDSLGHPAYTVIISKSRPAVPSLQFILEWNPDERAFQERQPENSRSVVSAPSLGPDLSPAPGSVLALEPAGGEPVPAHRQPPGGQFAAHSGAERAG
jgi:protein ImuA